MVKIASISNEYFFFNFFPKSNIFLYHHHTVFLISNRSIKKLRRYEIRVVETS